MWVQKAVRQMRTAYRLRRPPTIPRAGGVLALVRVRRWRRAGAGALRGAGGVLALVRVRRWRRAGAAGALRGAGGVLALVLASGM